MTVKRTRKGTRLDLKMYAYRGAQGGIGLLGPWGHTLRTTDEVLGASGP